MPCECEGARLICEAFIAFGLFVLLELFAESIGNLCFRRLAVPDAKLHFLWFPLSELYGPLIQSCTLLRDGNLC